MEVRAWVSGAEGLVGRKCGLSCLSPPEMPSFPKAVLPSQTGKPQRSGQGSAAWAVSLRVRIWPGCPERYLSEIIWASKPDWDIYHAKSQP